MVCFNHLNYFSLIKFKLLSGGDEAAQPAPRLIKVLCRYLYEWTLRLRYALASRGEGVEQAPVYLPGAKVDQ